MTSTSTYNVWILSQNGFLDANGHVRREELTEIEAKNNPRCTCIKDPAADLRQNRHRKEKGKEEDLVDRVLGEDSTWEHAVNPLELAFPKEIIIGRPWMSLACLQVGLEFSLVAKTKAEEALLAAKDQALVLKVEKDSALEKLDSLSQQLSQKEVARLDEDIKVLKAQLESSQLSVSKDQQRAESAESRLKSLSASLETTRAELRKTTEEANDWCTKWKSLGTEAKEICQETLEIVLDQVSHLCPDVDFSAINLKTRWEWQGLLLRRG
ncbi:hypothetical protein PIB30_021689 [Stylosanthes scabra]|uniref:Uncharacterized protein n=1 Tax=Stylosanthes scabra TaxID=79078 RepID=A0ABU6Q8S8_9FABA|nr:hypothetical protein [Stylosanthes scabra]